MNIRSTVTAVANKQPRTYPALVRIKGETCLVCEPAPAPGAFDPIYLAVVLNGQKIGRSFTINLQEVREAEDFVGTVTLATS